MNTIINECILTKVASIEDVFSIYKLCEEVITTYEDSDTVDVSKALSWSYHKIETYISEYQTIYFKGNKVGYYRLYNEDGMWELDDFYIFEEYRNMGIGSAVLGYLTNNYSKMFLYVFVKNIGAVRLYEKFGFKVCAMVGSTRAIMEYSKDVI